MNRTDHPTSLQDVLYAFSLAKAVPDADLLDDFVRLYPEYTDDLTDFAISLALDAAIVEDDTAPHSISTAVSPTVSRAMSRFQNRLYDIRKMEEATTTRSQASPVSVANPFASLDKNEFRGVASRLRANTVFVQKLRDRQIDPNTMTTGFKQQVADELNVPLNIIIAHLSALPQIPPNQHYKAEQKPDIGAQQTFEDAVRSSQLSADQQHYLLSL